MSFILLMSATVLRRSSSALPLGEPICVSEMNANRKGFICASAETQQARIIASTSRYVFMDGRYRLFSVTCHHESQKDSGTGGVGSPATLQLSSGRQASYTPTSCCSNR